MTPMDSATNAASKMHRAVIDGRTRKTPLHERMRSDGGLELGLLRKHSLKFVIKTRSQLDGMLAFTAVVASRAFLA